MKTKEHEPSRFPRSVDEAMQLYKEEEKRVAELPDPKDPEKIVRLRVGAEALDRELLAVLAHEVETPEVVRKLEKNRLPQWTEVSHKIERV